MSLVSPSLDGFEADKKSIWTLQEIYWDYEISDKAPDKIARIYPLEHMHAKTGMCLPVADATLTLRLDFFFFLFSQLYTITTTRQCHPCLSTLKPRRDNV